MKQELKDKAKLTPLTLPLTLVVLGWVVLGMNAQGASFECVKAQTKVEKLICDNSKLSELDSKLGQVYQDVLSKANDEQKLRVVTEQKHWLKFTRNVCEKETCLKHAYWSRQAALENYFEPRSPLYQHESDKAEDIKQVLATAPLYPSYKTQFCLQIFDDLKQMKDISFVDPVVQTQSYEDPALDPWKKQCLTAPPFNFAYWCDRNIVAADADDVLDGCNAGYGLPPFKLYELPPADASGEKRYVFYTDDSYGPMNWDFRKPALDGGFEGFQQIHIAKCLSARGSHWERGSKIMSSWDGAYADAGQGGRNGKNYNSIIKYKKLYYFFVLHVQYESYWLNISSVVPNGTKEKQVCDWSPVKQ